MNPETLDALIMDQALGALPPDVDALLGAYLARDIDAAATATQTRAALALAGRVTRNRSEPLTLPSFPGAAMRRAHRRHVQWQWAGRAAAMAACVALGIVVGRSFHSNPAEPRVVANAASPPPTTPAMKRAPSQFWSVQRWYDLAQAAPRSDAGQIRWSMRPGSSATKYRGD